RAKKGSRATLPATIGNDVRSESEFEVPLSDLVPKAEKDGMEMKMMKTTVKCVNVQPGNVNVSKSGNITTTSEMHERNSKSPSENQKVSYMNTPDSSTVNERGKSDNANIVSSRRREISRRLRRVLEVTRGGWSLVWLSALEVVFQAILYVCWHLTGDLQSDGASLLEKAMFFVTHANITFIIRYPQILWLIFGTSLRHKFKALNVAVREATSLCPSLGLSTHQKPSSSPTTLSTFRDYPTSSTTSIGNNLSAVLNDDCVSDSATSIREPVDFEKPLPNDQTHVDIPRGLTHTKATSDLTSVEVYDNSQNYTEASRHY
ncbi:hypothetical protein Hamer_G006719, partial [Homarus americanus]